MTYGWPIKILQIFISALICTQMSLPNPKRTGGLAYSWPANIIIFKGRASSQVPNHKISEECLWNFTVNLFMVTLHPENVLLHPTVMAVLKISPPVHEAIWELFLFLFF